MTKEERITQERERLTEIFKDLDANQLQTAAGLISSAAFLRVTLEDLEAEINNEGCTEAYVNGRDQSGVKASAACQVYASFNTKYQSTIQKLLKITPPAPRKPKEKSAIELAVERSEAERRERYERNQRRDKEIGEAFAKAYKGKPQSVEAYREFKEEWERQHADYDNGTN